MSQTIDYLTPAPGRTVVPLGARWTAVILQPVPWLPAAFVGLFHGAELVEIVEEPAEVHGYLLGLDLVGDLCAGT